MLKLFVVLVLLGAHNTCHGDTSETDWRRRGWYRPRRNYASQSQSQNAFGIRNAGYSQSTDNQNQGTGFIHSFGSTSYTQSPQTQSPFGSFGQKVQAQNSLGTGYNRIPEQNSYSNRQNSQSAFFGISNSQNFPNTFGANNGFNSNFQSLMSFGNSFRQNSRADYVQNTQSQNSFGFGYNQQQNQNNFKTTQNQNPFGNSYTQNSQNQNAYKTNYNQQPHAQSAFGYRQNAQIQNAFGSSSQNTQSQNTFGQNTFQFKNVTSNNLNIGSSSSNFARGQGTFKGPDYLPPYIATGYLPSKDPTTTTRRPYYTTTTTRRPFYTTTTTSRPFFTTTTTRRPFYTTTTTKRPKIANPSPLPAMAMRVPPEPEDDPTTPKTSTPFDDGASLVPDRTIMTPPVQVSPAMAMPVPPEPEDDPTTRRPSTPEDDPSPVTTPSTTTTTLPPITTTTTTPPPTTTTTTTTTPPPTTTTTTTPPTTTTTTTTITTITPPTDLDRLFIEEKPTTTTTTLPPPIPFDPYKAPEYLPPKIHPAIPPSPAMAMPVPPEPECDPLDPSTYPFPLGIDQRHPRSDNFSQDPCTYVPLRTTTKKPFMGPAYLPPAVNTRVGRSPKTLRLADVKGARPVWHAGLYTKTTRPYKQICGGSIVRMDVVITAAHCVWNDDTFLEPAENYAVGANKVYRPWTEPQDKRAQQSDVREIIVPPRFRGGKTSFQDDIAVLKLVTPFTYARGLRPVCINFDDDFDTEQLAEGNSGTVAGWGYTDEVGSPTQYLLWLELPYVDIEKCIAGADNAFLKYITSDKICAGENHTGKALCRGDSGGGLVFWHGDGEVITPYLRGIASASARADNKECNVDVVGGFTQLTAHRRFLRRHVPDLDLNCRYQYT